MKRVLAVLRHMPGEPSKRVVDDAKIKAVLGDTAKAATRGASDDSDAHGAQEWKAKEESSLSGSMGLVQEPSINSARWK
jgi:hypothetical protein